MSAAKKVSMTKKRKYSSPASHASKVSRRLEKLRHGQGDLWGDDDDDLQPCVRPKPTTAAPTTTGVPNNNTYIVLTDSDDEKSSSRRRGKATKSHKKSSETSHDQASSDQDFKPTSKCVTCLICSILKTLNSYNCCHQHLSVLLKKVNVVDSNEIIERGLPQQVMIVPVTDDLLQRYLEPEQIHQLKTSKSTSPNQKKTIERTASGRSLSKKSHNISDLSAIEPTHANKVKTANKSCMTEIDLSDHASGVSMVTEPIGPTHSTAIPTDTTFTVAASTSASTASFESPTVLDTCQIQQMSDPAIVVIDDSQSDQSQSAPKTQNPWVPISDETYAAVEVALNHLEPSSEELTEFTPATARRIPTEVMASCLPKIQLKQGRYRHGKPIQENKTTEPSKDDRPISVSQSSSSSATSSSGSSVVITSVRAAPSTLATIVEDESLILPPQASISNRSAQVLTERHENTTEGLSDTVMSCLFAQDESSQSDFIAAAAATVTTITATTSKTIPHDNVMPLILPRIVVEDYSDVRPAQPTNLDVSESSQFSNDQNDSQPVPTSTTTDKTTPARVTYRMNPDGTRVSISRPSPASTHRTPSIQLQRARVDSATVTHPGHP